MGRKNRNVDQRHNQVSKRGVFSRGAVVQPHSPTWHPSLETPVEPDGRCGGRPDGKYRYVGEDKAEAALKQAQRRRQWQNNPHAESRYYECKKCTLAGDDAPAFHLTSKNYDDE